MHWDTSHPSDNPRQLHNRLIFCLRFSHHSHKTEKNISVFGDLIFLLFHSDTFNTMMSEQQLTPNVTPKRAYGTRSMVPYTSVPPLVFEDEAGPGNSIIEQLKQYKPFSKGENKRVQAYFGMHFLNKRTVILSGRLPRRLEQCSA